MNILITGTAGFIGFHLGQRLLKDGHAVIGLDSINDYYDVKLKHGRLEAAGIEVSHLRYNHPTTSSRDASYIFYKLHLENKELLLKIFEKHQPDIIIHLAAQAGVRYSLINPDAYIHSNINGFINILECCRHIPVRHLLYASSSSVYGLNDEIPFSEEQFTDHPASLYAATKKSNELMAHVYSHLFGIPTTGLRFFTVYGPWSRPDMALFLFTKAIVEGRPIQVFNYGDMRRDFTYIDDITEGIARLMHKVPQPNETWTNKTSSVASSGAPYKIYNIGHNEPVNILYFIETIEKELGIKAIKEFLSIQPGDVPVTFANVDSLINDVGYKPSTSVPEGVRNFVKWYREYYNV